MYPFSPSQIAEGNRLLLLLADFLENDPRVPGHFAMDNITVGCDALRRPGDCGTKACMLGWAPMVPALRKAGVRYGLWGVLGDGPAFVLGDRPAFVLTPEEHQELFFEWDPQLSTDHLKAARRIREFVARRS